MGREVIKLCLAFIVDRSVVFFFEKDFVVR